MACQDDIDVIGNDKQYWERQFTSRIERKMKIAQAGFFYKYFEKMMPEKLCAYLAQNEYSCCDFGCGLGNFTNNLYRIFPKFDIYGVDFSDNAISYAKKHFPHVSFINTDLDCLNQKFDVVVTSNTLEHFSNPSKVLQKLLEHTQKFFIMMVPYEERELYEEHLFNFERDFFKLSIADFDLIYLRVTDLSSVFNTMWLGKQVLAIYKHKSVKIDFPFEEKIEKQKFGVLGVLNYKINCLRRNLYRKFRSFLTSRVV